MRSTFLALFILTLYVSIRQITLSTLLPITASSIYLWLMLLTPLNLFIIFQMPPNTRFSFYIFCSFLFEAFVLETFYLLEITLGDVFYSVALVFWLLLFVFLLFSISSHPSIQKNASFFADLLIFLSLLNIEDTLTFILSLSFALFILFVSDILSAIYSYFRDELTGLYSIHSFKRHDKKTFPPKYTIAFFYLDNYSKLLNVFKQNLTDKLTLMVLQRALSLEPPALIYRLKSNQFCLIFFDMDVKQTYELIENMRRLIAGTEFVLNKKQILKLTITPIVSEKRRSDADVFDVLMRMHENFRQRYTFTQNMTFCEEIEQTKKTRRLSHF